MTSDKKWEAVINNDEKYDGIFFYAVKTTGIFCKPSCKSKMPKRKNVEYFDTKEKAYNANYRSCKRCRPDLLLYEPNKEIVEKIKKLADNYFSEKQVLQLEMKQIGLTSHRIVEIFKEQYGLTVNEYINKIRFEKAKILLENTDDEIIDIAYSVGFNSLSTFYRVFKKCSGQSPAVYKKRIISEK